MKFSDFVGQTIVLLVPRFNGNTVVYCKLLGVEESGVWVESQTVTNMLLQALKAQTAPKSLVWFFPYHEISFAAASTDAPALNEKSFGRIASRFSGLLKTACKCPFSSCMFPPSQSSILLPK
jgi:hypothetical protein